MEQNILLQPASREEYWQQHEAYLHRDIFPYVSIGRPLTPEDQVYFQSATYRDTIDALCVREIDRAQRVFFVLNGEEIGFCLYCTYHSEDGKCFILDYCIYPAFRGRGLGAACFSALRAHETQAAYFELNLSNENNRRFWRSQGFRFKGFDDFGSALYSTAALSEED